MVRTVVLIKSEAEWIRDTSELVDFLSTKCQYMLRLICGVLWVQLEWFSYFFWDPKFAPLYRTRSDTVLFESLYFCHRSFLAFQEDNAAPYTADNSVHVWTYSFCALCWFFNFIKSRTFVALTYTLSAFFQIA